MNSLNLRCANNNMIVPEHCNNNDEINDYFNDSELNLRCGVGPDVVDTYNSQKFVSTLECVLNVASEKEVKGLVTTESTFSGSNGISSDMLNICLPYILPYSN
ncbi:hypothetical protein WA026_021571 [Henosepilachna vigintioctopunctata]|uniref:Uncharacterized protein n=1 Tax=Henosepilachna vigintioctopunctata TaxID=420089 RepID=A0AAW1VIF9_9CUCU